MELSTAHRLLPLLAAIQPSSPPKPRVRQAPLSPPVQFQQLYQQLVLKEKEFIRTNPYAQRLASHFASRRSLPRRKFKTPEAKPMARKETGLGVDGSAVLSLAQKTPFMRCSMDRYDLDKTWVPALPLPHHRTASIEETKSGAMSRASLSPRDRSKVTTVNISLPSVLRTSRQSDLMVQSEREGSAGPENTLDSQIRRSRRLPSKAGVFPAT